jgi:hypothetical protein
VDEATAALHDDNNILACYLILGHRMIFASRNSRVDAEAD